MDDPTFLSLLEKAVESRAPLFDPAHRSAFRLFHGFREGEPDLVIDLYGSTLVFHNYAEEPVHGMALVQQAKDFLLNRYPWFQAGVIKTRVGKTQEERRGRLLFGGEPDRSILENNVWYAIDLFMNRDASFYLDTRNLRHWLKENTKGKTVLNAFAYTGSLGVAAAAGGAARVVQLDRLRKFLNLAKESHTLNDFPIPDSDLIASDFFPAAARLKQSDELFDTVIIDPPFFSTTSKGTVDQVNESARIINKVRPLVKDGGTLVALNNALYVSGQEYLQTIESLCSDGYMSIRELIPVPEDMTGYNQMLPPITDPSPFNHSTKIAILDIKRK